MSKGAWLGCLLLALVGTGTDLGAQEVRWRSAERPGDCALDGGTPRGAVELGRPCPLPTPPLLPEAVRRSPVHAELVTVSSPALLPVEVRAAVSELARGGEDDEAEDEASHSPSQSQFAQERVVLAQAPVVAAVTTRTAPSMPDPVVTHLPPTSPPAAPAHTPTLPTFPAPVAVHPDDCCDHGFGGEVDLLRPRWWLQAEYLLWWMRSDHVPPLVITGNVISTNPPVITVLGQNGTRILAGGNGLNGDLRSGFRLTGGYWVDDVCQEEGFELSGFYLGSHTAHSDTSSLDHNGVLARPFFKLNPNQPGENAELVGFPGLASGDARIAAPSHFWGGEFNYRGNVCCDDCKRVDVFLGLRYVQLDEALSIIENIVGLDNATDPRVQGKNITVFDSFRTWNYFYGAQIGVEAERKQGPWSFGVRGKLALGDTHQVIDIDGGQTVVDRVHGTVQSFLGGLYTAGPNPANGTPGNIGRFSRDRFSAVPEIDLTVSYHLNDHWRVFGGYDLVYWSNVVRPGGQIDRNLDTTNVPNLKVQGDVPTGQNRPGVLFKDTDFWAQGFHLGVEWKF
jgi:hypothetical protein